MDMFQPTSMSDNQPISFGDAIGQRSNSLIGLGLGLLQPTNPFRGINAATNALQGYQSGETADETRAKLIAAQRQHAEDLAFRKSEAARQGAQFQQTFAASQETPFQKMQRDIAKNGPAAEQFYAQQLGNVPQITSIDDPDSPGDKKSVIWNPRAPPGQRLTDIYGRPVGGAAAPPDPFANAINPLAGGSDAPSVSAGPAGGSGAVGYTPGGAGATQPGAPMPGAQPGQPGQGSVEAKTMRQERAKAVIANEKDAQLAAKAAAEIKPDIDRMTAIYAQLHQNGGIGPNTAHPVARNAKARFGYDAQNEALRQEYDVLEAKVRALITSAQNKGQGSVSNYERQMYGQQFPQLTAADSQSQLAILQQMRAANDATIGAGRGTSLGAGASTYQRPAISDPLGQARAAIAGGAPRDAVIQRLRERGIDPSGL
jgi:hypothetical protein